MQTKLEHFLEARLPLLEDATVWGGGSLPLRVTCYLGDEIPPLDYVTSVRSLVFQGEQILVGRDPSGSHILPGGRREAGEALEATLRREILEETGCTLGAIAMLGFMQFHHLSPKPPGYRYPHPDFVQLVFRADATEIVPGAAVSDDWELGSEFHPIAELAALKLSARERFFLDAAIRARADNLRT
jgi:8-oxo-dGTP pyrophosphatase MutT (NUDIX family)